MLESVLRSRLDDVVWEGGLDAFSDALAVVGSQWCHPWVAASVSQWARRRADEYREKSRWIQSKCDVNDPGVNVMYEHYLKISLRYEDVQSALSDRANAR